MYDASEIIWKHFTALLKLSTIQSKIKCIALKLIQYKIIIKKLFRKCDPYFDLNQVESLNVT